MAPFASFQLYHYFIRLASLLGNEGCCKLAESMISDILAHLPLGFPGLEDQNFVLYYPNDQHSACESYAIGMLNDIGQSHCWKHLHTPPGNLSSPDLGLLLMNALTAHR